MAKTKLEIQKEYEKRTGYEAQNKYLKENSVSFTMKLFPRTEGDIVERLNQQDNKAGYVKRLIREDIAKEK